MKRDLDMLQEQAETLTDPQSKDAELLMLNIQMEMLKTQQKMLKKWTDIGFWVAVIGLISLVSFVLALLNL